MATFIVMTSTDWDHNSVMEIVRQRSLMYHNMHGGPGFCNTEIIGNSEDHQVFVNAIKIGNIKAEIEITEE